MQSGSCNPPRTAKARTTAIMLFVFASAIAIVCHPPSSRRPVPGRHLAPSMEMRAVLMPCALEDAMVPGESRWLYVYDETRAALMRTARSLKYSGLIAQLLSKPTSFHCGGDIVPLLRLQETRNLDRAGAFAEVVCVGRGLVSASEEQPLYWHEDSGAAKQLTPKHIETDHGGLYRTASVTAFSDHSDQESVELCDAAVRDLNLWHGNLRNATAQVIEANRVSEGVAARQQLGWSAGDDATSSLEALIRRPLEELVSEQRISMQRQGLIESQDFDDAELLSYAASRCLEGEARKYAIESRSTRERLELCTDALRERHGRLLATRALQQAMAHEPGHGV